MTKQRRLFLNKPGYHSVGAIYASAPDDGGSNELVISDCNHTVSFAVGVYDADDKRNVLFKLNRMIDVITWLRDAVQEQEPE